MHHLLLFSLSPLFLFTTALAHPSPSPPLAPRIGVPGGLYLCAGPRWTQCQAWMPPVEAGRCHELAAGSVVGSLGPDPGGYCVLYWGYGCEAKTAFKVVVFPGVAEKLERFASWRCGVGAGPVGGLEGVRGCKS